LLTAGALDLPEGTIYPALYRLERLGLVTSGESTVDGRRRRIYRITPPGRTALQDRSDAWRTLVKQVEAVLRAAPLRA
jgi:PadR family transcriptional regulator, regulatory protein PadR